MLSPFFHTPRGMHALLILPVVYQCISEMRNKAAYFKKTGLVITLDSDINNVVKSDGIVTAELHQALRASFNKLHAAQAADPDWHPWTDNKVQDLVHPSMYPFIYGKAVAIFAF